MYRVVVADDDGKACKKAVEFLQNNGYQVVGEAADGLEAVMVCRRERPDFVIMDLSMPVMTGLEAIRVIHRSFPNKRILRNNLCLPACKLLYFG